LSHLLGIKKRQEKLLYINGQVERQHQTISILFDEVYS